MRRSSSSPTWRAPSRASVSADARRTGVHDAHVERDRAPGDLLADVAESHDAERLAGQLGDRLLEPGQRPVGLGQRGVGGHQLLGEGEHEGEGLLGHVLLLGPAGTDVAHGHAPLARGVQVDVVEAVARALDQLQVRCRGDVSGGHRAEARDDDMGLAQRDGVLVRRLHDGDADLPGKERGERGSRRTAADVRGDDGEHVLRDGHAVSSMRSSGPRESGRACPDRARVRSNSASRQRTTCSTPACPSRPSP